MTSFGRILQRYGDVSEITAGGETREARSFIQPVMSRGNSVLWREETVLGTRDRRRYYWFGDSTADISDPENTVIKTRGREFDVLRADAYIVEGDISHWEAVLELREEAAGDGV